jgi:hypothetical protein
MRCYINDTLSNMFMDEGEYIYYIKSISIFFIMYMLYIKFDKSYILLALLFTIPLFLAYEMSDFALPYFP